MKVLATLILAASMLVAPSFAQEVKKGYDLGQCSADAFVAAHIKLIGKDISMDMAAEGPHNLSPMDPPITYKFVLEDKEGKHFEYVQKSGKKLQLVLDFKAGFGYFTVNDGKAESIIFLVEDEDGSKLDEKAVLMFNVCKKLVEDTSDTDEKKDMPLVKS